MGAVDEHGERIRDAIIWMDSRGAPYVRRITGGAVRVQGYGVTRLARWLRVTGGIPTHSGKDPVAHILWLKHEEPETYRRTHLFLEPKDWLNARLTGRLAASFDSILGPLSSGPANALGVPASRSWPARPTSRRQRSGRSHP